MGGIGQRFRELSWILLLASALMMFYSGLFFWSVLPLPPIHRFWDGGFIAFTVSGFLDLIGGGAAFILVIVMLMRGLFRSPPSNNFIKNLRILVILCVLGIMGDLIGGLYAIGAQIGLYSCIIDWIIVRE